MRNVEIMRNADGGITLKAKMKHGPNGMHTLNLSPEDVSAMRAEAAALHAQLHRSPPASSHAPHASVVGIETLDADLIDLRKQAKKWSATEIVAGDDMGGEANEECLRGI